MKLVRESIFKGPSKEEVEKGIENAYVDEVLSAGIQLKDPDIIRKAAEKYYEYQDLDDDEDVKTVLEEELFDLIHNNEVEVIETLVETGLLEVFDNEALEALYEEAVNFRKQEIAKLFNRVRR